MWSSAFSRISFSYWLRYGGVSFKLVFSHTVARDLAIDSRIGTLTNFVNGTIQCRQSSGRWICGRWSCRCGSGSRHTAPRPNHTRCASPAMPCTAATSRSAPASRPTCRMPPRPPSTPRRCLSRWRRPMAAWTRSLRTLTGVLVFTCARLAGHIYAGGLAAGVVGVGRHHGGSGVFGPPGTGSCPGLDRAVVHLQSLSGVPACAAPIPCMPVIPHHPLSHASDHMITLKCQSVSL